MKPQNRINCLLAISSFILIISCQKETTHQNQNQSNGNNSGNNGGTVVTPTPLQGNVTGKVVDNNNNAVTGATVKAGSNITTTDSRGIFRFNNIQLDKYASMITVEKNGFFKGYRVFSATANNTNFIKLQLVPKTLSGSVDAATGGSVTLTDNSKITLPSSGIVLKSNNQNYSGSIKVYTSFIDPTSQDISQIVPGSFQGDDANNTRVLLKSYGMLAIELEGSNGEQLQISSGKKAKLRFTIPSSLRSSAPATIPLWYVDESTGLWKEEGSATKGSDYYEGDVSHFSFWNCDVSSNQVIYLDLTVADSKGGTLPYTNVKITRSNGGGSSYGYTDSTGHVSGLVPANETLLLEILNSCYQAVYSQNIGPFSTGTNLGTITITPQPVNSLSISGSAVNCNNQAVTNGNALIYFDGLYYNTPITNGNFSLTVIRCSSVTSIEVIAVDNTGSQQSSAWTGSASSGTVNTGALAACGTSSVSFINYIVDGTNYSISTANVGDSITTWTSSGSTQTLTWVSGFKVSQQTTRVFFYTQAAAVGTFPLEALTINQMDSVQLVSPFNISFTTFGSTGQFIEGNFTGQIRERVSNNLHNVSATFRVRRN